MKYYDVVVVGAGPAGSTAAYLLAKNNVKTLLIEKEDLPRPKVCGGALTKKTVKLNDRVFDQDLSTFKKNQIINAETDDIKLNFRKNHIVSFKTGEKMYFTNRRDYDFFLFQEAELEGVETLVADGVNTFDFTNNKLNTQSGEAIEYGHLFAADGASSPVKKTLLKARNDFSRTESEHLAIGIEAYLPRRNAPKNISNDQSTYLHLGVVNWGYGWVFPRGDQVIIGVGGLQTENKNIRQTLNDYGKILGIDLGQASIKGHPFPFGNFMQAPVHGNILFIGDAGGFADPLSGEGIFYAQRTAELAAQAYLEQGNTTTGSKYLTLIQQHIIPDLTGSYRIRPLVYGGPAELQQFILKVGSKFFGPEKIRNLAFHQPFNWNYLSSMYYGFFEE